MSSADEIGLSENDVLCGRGGGSFKQPGNVLFRRLVNANKVTYANCRKFEKMRISRGIVTFLRNQTPPGRFLEQNTVTGLWYDIGEKKALEKTSQALREGAPKLRGKIKSESPEPIPPNSSLLPCNAILPIPSSAAATPDMNTATATASSATAVTMAAQGIVQLSTVSRREQNNNMAEEQHIDQASTTTSSSVTLLSDAELEAVAKNLIFSRTNSFYPRPPLTTTQTSVEEAHNEGFLVRKMAAATQASGMSSADTRNDTNHIISSNTNFSNGYDITRAYHPSAPLQIATNSQQMHCNHHQRWMLLQRKIKERENT